MAQFIFPISRPTNQPANRTTDLCETHQAGRPTNQSVHSSVLHFFLCFRIDSIKSFPGQQSSQSLCRCPFLGFQCKLINKHFCLPNRCRGRCKSEEELEFYYMVTCPDDDEQKSSHGLIGGTTYECTFIQRMSQRTELCLPAQQPQTRHHHLLSREVGWLMCL